MATYALDKARFSLTVDLIDDKFTTTTAEGDEFEVTSLHSIGVTVYAMNTELHDEDGHYRFCVSYGPSQLPTAPEVVQRFAEDLAAMRQFLTNRELIK